MFGSSKGTCLPQMGHFTVPGMILLSNCVQDREWVGACGNVLVAVLGAVH
jgi:hypothetical protein